METESGASKPGDLYIGVIDLFGLLIPGIFAAALIVGELRITPNADVFSYPAS
jgi:hypothetical protein